MDTRKEAGRDPDAGVEPSAAGRYEKVFLDHVETLRRAARALGLRHRWTADELAEFTAWMLFRIIRQDYAVLRAYRGRCKMSTYLHTVVANLFRDFRNSRWGKWRPSAAARRLGELAVTLETLTCRDGFGHDEAVEIVKGRSGHEVSRRRLRELASALSKRPTRRFEDIDDIELPSLDPAPDEHAENRDRRRALRRAREALAEALNELSEADRRILELHFGDGLTVAEIARRLELSQRALYTRRDRSLGRLRQAFGRRGLDWDDVQPLIGWQETEMNLLRGAA